MDLAKIRQKARQEQENHKPDETQSKQEQLQPEVTQPAQAKVQPNVIQLAKTEFPESVSIREDDLWQLHSVQDELLRDIPSSFNPKPLPSFQSGYSSTPFQRDPFKVILAGREAAGCDEEQPLVHAAESDTAVKEYQEYLCFRVSDETYGINIMDIKEIIKPREVTEVPRAPSFVSGIISLRGIIIPIIDMMIRLGLPRETVTGRERVIVVRNVETFSGLLVDEIFQVVHIAKDCFESAPSVLDGIDRDFVTGIGRADGRMIILLNLENIADIRLC